MQRADKAFCRPVISCYNNAIQATDPSNGRFILFCVRDAGILEFLQCCHQIVIAGIYSQFALDNSVTKRGCQAPVIARILSLRNCKCQLLSQCGKCLVSFYSIACLSVQVGRTPANCFITSQLDFFAGEVCCQSITNCQFVFIFLRPSAPTKVGSLAQA